MKIFKTLTIFVFLSLGIASCNPTDDQDMEQNQIEVVDNTGDPLSEETDEDDELETND